jgi:hypothetical protein
LVKPREVTSAAVEMTAATEEQVVEAPEGGEQAERPEEAFEATIVRLDGPAAERLFRKAGE